MLKPSALRCGQAGPLPLRLKATPLRRCGRPPKPLCAVIRAAAASAGDAGDAAADWSDGSQYDGGGAGGDGGAPKRGRPRQPVDEAVAGKISDLKRRLRMAERKLEVRGSMLVARQQRRAAAALLKPLAFCRPSPLHASACPSPSVEPLPASAPCLPPCRGTGGAGARGGAAALPSGSPQARRHGQLTLCSGPPPGNRASLAGQDAVGGRHGGCAPHAAALHAKCQHARMHIAAPHPPTRPPTIFSCRRRPVVILGEPGLGKDNLAALVHFGSPFHAAPFVRLDCDR
jgi:hypothetical protein